MCTTSERRRLLTNRIDRIGPPCPFKTYTVGEGAPAGPVVYEKWNHSWLGGLIGEPNVGIAHLAEERMGEPIDDRGPLSRLLHDLLGAEFVDPGQEGIIMPEALTQTEADDLQTVTLAVAAEAEAGERVIVVGDVGFLQEQFVRSNPQNLLFVANAIDWLAQDEALIDIRSKTRTPPAMVFTSDFQKTALKWGNLVGMPLLFVLGGTARVTGRRRRAEARWRKMT